MTNLIKFEKELADLLNKYSLGNDCNTADFILAQFLQQIIEDLKLALEQRDDMHNSMGESQIALEDKDE